MEALKHSLPNYTIREVQLDKMTMVEQMRSFSQADIVIGN